MPRGRKPLSMEDAIERFWERVERRSDDECWLWQGPPAATGYGQLVVQRRHWTAHAFAYYISNFGIEPGLHIDHTCHNTDLSCPGGSTCQHRLCCNPAHLLARTPKANLDAANAARQRAGFKRECPQGHPLDGVLVRRSGPREGAVHRYCKQCNRANQARIKAARC